MMADPAVVGGGLGAAITAALLAVVRHLEIKKRFSNGTGMDVLSGKLDSLIEIQREQVSFLREASSSLAILRDRSDRERPN